MRSMNASQAWRLLLVCLSGWVNRHQLDVIACIQEENRVLKSKLKGKRIRFTDDERRRLAVKGKAMGNRVLREVASIVTPNPSSLDPELAESDPNLAAVIRSWPTLPEPVRAGITAMVRATTERP